MFTFYVTISSDKLTRRIREVMPTVPVLIPASSFYRPAGKRRSAYLMQPRLPERISDRAADCGGFVATFHWGDYRYTPAIWRRWSRQSKLLSSKSLVFVMVNF